VSAQSGSNAIEGRLVAGDRQFANVRVRLIYQDGMRPVGETFTRQDGQFTFGNLIPGNYVIEVEETPNYEAAQATLELREMVTNLGFTAHITIPLRAKAVARTVPGVVAADVDVNVPADARRHYDAAVVARDAGDNKRATSELRAAVAAAPEFYSARLDLARQLRADKKFAEAREVAEPLVKIAPKHAEPLVELGMIALALDRREDAVSALKEAIALDDNNWAAHLYLGYALLDVKDEEAEPHFWKALKLNERDAAKAHLALARLAHRYGYKEDAVKQLEAYLAVVPDAPDAAEVRKLADKLRREK
jgi:tetratricopeptide (TPR) repeat protein